MFHSLVGADCRTCGEIMAIALAGSISTLMLWISLIISIATWRVETEAPAALAQANVPVIEIAKGATSVTVDAPIVGASPLNRHNKETRG